MLHWKGRGSGSAAPRVDWPVYPRRAEHNTVTEGGNRRLGLRLTSNIPPAEARFVELLKRKADTMGGEHV